MSFLNDCVYSGINLFTEVLDLLIRFRMDRYVIQADIKKTFLKIKLKNVKDRNRFWFFVKVKDKLVWFRYKTLTYGFVASPFILNFVLEHHVENYPMSTLEYFTQ